MLRIFAFDPGVSTDFSTSVLGETTLALHWEPDLDKGPIGEYVEVIDVDPASGVTYKPVNLNDPHLLAQDGLAPSETNPQFHQQMVYAVAMATIQTFEAALGRVALWSNRRVPDKSGKRRDIYVKRLRIYPHALREQNAYYSSEKKAVLFGYFPVGSEVAAAPPGTLVFTCLSHDIVAHEVTHALLDGVHPRFTEPTHPDVLAFHEGFADIVALFQRFSYPGQLREVIARARGDLASDNLLGQLAQQFGKSTGRGHALRDAIGSVDPKSGKWKLNVPDPRRLRREREPHGRGSILVAAIFGAFLTVYRARTADLYRIATDGTGVLRDGAIHPDLSARLADEASRCAHAILKMCVRAIDYCPPVDIRFGDYLRAIVTSDVALYSDDPLGCRLAFVDSFRQWGITPEGMSSMSVEALLWPEGPPPEPAVRALFSTKRTVGSTDQPESAASQKFEVLTWTLDGDRRKAWDSADENAKLFWTWLMQGEGSAFARHIGIVLDTDTKPTVYRSKTTLGPAVQVQRIRPALRHNARGDLVRNLVVEVTQRRRGYFDPDKQKQRDSPDTTWFAGTDDGDFIFRTGCTLLFDPDPERPSILRVIKTRGMIDDDGYLDKVRKFLLGIGDENNNAFDSSLALLRHPEPFRLLHSSEDELPHD
jgi:hypothetical protein